MENSISNEDQSILDDIAASLRQVASAKASAKKEMGTDEQRELFKTIAHDAVARKQYAESRAQQIIPLIPEQSTVRSIFMPEVLTGDAQPEYPISFDYTNLASFMPKLGGNVVRVVEGDTLFIPTFGIEGAVRYSMDVAEQGRLDIGALSMQHLRDNIVSKEELAGWRTIKGTLSGLNTDQTVYCSGTEATVADPENFHNFTKKAVNKMLTQMDLQRRTLTDIYASPRSIHDVKEWSNNQIDFNTEREIFVNGGLAGNENSSRGVNGGTIWDTKLHKVYNSALVADNEAYGFDGQRFGKMPIRKELKTFEDPTAILQWQIGVLARELVGFGVTDSWAIVKASLDSTHTGSSCTAF